MGLLRRLGLALCVCFVILALVDAGLRAAMRPTTRLTEDFSSAYLAKVLRDHDVDGKVLVLGDSVMWGYRLQANDTFAQRLRARGVPTVNLAFEGGSVANVYAMLVALRAWHATPKLIVFNVNIKSFNEADSAYERLHPAVEDLAWRYLSPSQRADLEPTRPQTTDARIDRALSRVWALYGMRADIRERLFGAPDAASALVTDVGDLSGRNARDEALHQPTPDRFLGTYDLSPLSGANVEVRFLRRTVHLLRAWHVPAVALLTPTNHALLHEYIDAPEYDANLAYLRRVLEPTVRTLDLDRALPGKDFLDNDHLTALGNDRLAAMVRPVLVQ